MTSLSSRCFSRYSAPICWLAHGYMTSNSELFPAKCHERATLRKLWRQTGNSSQLPAKCWPLLHVHVIWSGLMSLLKSQRIFQNLLSFCFAILQITLWLVPWGTVNLFPLNLNVSLDFISGNKIHCSPIYSREETTSALIGFGDVDVWGGRKTTEKTQRKTLGARRESHVWDWATLVEGKSNHH